MSSVVQSSGGSTLSLSSIAVPAFSAVMGAVFSYAVLKTTVKTVERDVGFIRKDLGELHTMVQESSVRIARIEGRIERE